LDLDGELDLVADHDAAGLHRHGDVDAEVAAVDLGGGGEAGPGVAPGVAAGAVELQVEVHRPGHAVEGELTLDQVAVALGTDRGGDVLRLRVLLDLEEVGRAQVVVAAGVTGVDRVGVDADV